MLWVTSTPQAGIEGYVVVADLEVLTCCLKVDFPPDAVDDQPMADLLATSLDHLEREPLEVFPNLWVGFMPLPKVLFAFLKSCHDLLPSSVRFATRHSNVKRRNNANWLAFGIA